MTWAICSSGAHIRDRSTTEEHNEQLPLIIESFSVLSSKSIDNQSMGEEKEEKEEKKVAF